MLARIRLLKGLTNVLKIQKAKFFFKPQFSPINSIFLTPKYNFSDDYLGDYSDFSMSKRVMQKFLSKKAPTPQEVVKALDDIEKYKVGLSTSEVMYKTFIQTIIKCLKGKFTPEQLDIIADKAYNIHIKDSRFWTAYLEALQTSKSDSDIKTFVSIANTLLRVKSYPQFAEIISKNLPVYQSKVEAALERLDLKQTVRASYVFAYFNAPFPALTHKLKYELQTNMPTLDFNLSADDIATAVLIVFNLLEEQDPDKERIIAELGRHFVSRDLLEYDVTLQHYEYDNPTPGESGVKDRLKWESIAFVGRVFSDSKYYDELTLDRLKSAIYRKSETDIVDFENAAAILSVYSRARRREENDFYLRIIEMVHLQLLNEGSDMFHQFDGKNIYHFLEAIIRLYNNEFDQELINDCFNYFAELIVSEQIKSKIQDEDYLGLKGTFQRAKGIHARFDERVIPFIQEKVKNLQIQ